MKKIFLSIIASVSMFGATSCSDMLEVESTRFVENPDLNQKTDSVFYAYGVIQAMQQLADQYFFQNEMRGDLVKTTSLASTHLQSLSNFSAGTECKYDSVYLYYKVINNCNYYLANRDTTLMTSNKNVVMNEYCAIAAFRAWAYLQMTHQYGDVPYVTEPVLSISQINSVTQNTDYRQILASQAEYLQTLKNKVSEDQLDVPYYRDRVDIGHSYYGATVYMYPSKLFVPLNIVLGDIYLELGEYQKAAHAYFDYLRYMAKTYGSSQISIANFEKRYDYLNSMSFLYPDDYNTDKNKELENGNWSSNYSGTSGSGYISYIQPAQDYTKGQITDMPIAFGYDYYSSEYKTVAQYTQNSLKYFNSHPETEKVQVQPSDIYMNLASKAPYYYYTKQLTVAPFTWQLSQSNLGDARANCLLPGRNDYSDLIFVSKPGFGQFYLYRNVTVYLRLAEAFNRMGYPELAFAILKTGMHTGIRSYLKSAYLPTSGIAEENYYIPDEAYRMLVDVIPFFSTENETYFQNVPSKYFIGVHSRGAGATDDLNSPYQYKSIVEERIEKIRSDFNLGMDGEPYTQDEYINAVEDLLCDEYALEFAFEGTRFSDLLRIARHKNMSSPYSVDFGDTWLSKKLESKAAGITTKNCYLPFK